ncbi:MAG: inositol monophosphatase [Edaphobacter sp.]|nr:inositol monophosphatase [Edaphobacter sp.]
MITLDQMLPAIRSIHEQIRDAVVLATEGSPAGELARVVEDGQGDTIYAIDRISEELLVSLFEREIAAHGVIVLIAEGLSNGRVVLPRGAREEHAQWRILADPIDGTRCLMYQKRSGWILTGVAPNRGESTSLADIELAVQTEIPLVKQHLCDSLWAQRGQGAFAERYNRFSGKRTPLALRASSAFGITDGFCSIARFFPGGRDILASIDDEIALAAAQAAGISIRPGKAYCFEDQYLSTGGQLYELIGGHDRFLADLRPLLTKPHSSRRDLPQLVRGLCCHPYDLCTELIARETGIEITDACGNSLDVPLNLEADVAWAGFANTRIRRLIEPLLLKALASRDMNPCNFRPPGFETHFSQ